ncbi:hypothetical protein BDR22DRAFT_587922 [Usnea florida]
MYSAPTAAPLVSASSEYFFAVLSSSTSASIKTFTSTATGSSLQPIQTSTFCPSQDNHCIVGDTDGRNFTIRCGYATLNQGGAFSSNSSDARDCVDQCDVSMNCVSVTYYGINNGSLAYNRPHPPKSVTSNAASQSLADRLIQTVPPNWSTTILGESPCLHSVNSSIILCTSTDIMDDVT